MLSYSITANNISYEKYAATFIYLTLHTVCLFSLEAFKIFSSSPVLNNVMMIYLSVIFFFIFLCLRLLFWSLWVSNVDLTWKQVATISSKFFFLYPFLLSFLPLCKNPDTLLGGSFRIQRRCISISLATRNANLRAQERQLTWRQRTRTTWSTEE